MNWHPIETAPKDRQILCYNGFMGVYSTSYTKAWKNKDGTIDKDYRGFPCGQTSGMLGAWDCQPSHWAELPEGPEETA